MIVELTWRCNSCDTKSILGRHKACPTCGSPREKGEMKMDGIEEAEAGHTPAVTDTDLLSLASAGADWFCRFCAAGNRGDGNHCEKCGSSRNEPEAPKPPPTPKPTRRPQVPRPEPAPAPSPPKRQYGNVVGAIVATFVVLFFLCVGFSIKEVPGEVSALRWQRTVVVQAWLPTTVREWEHRAFTREGRNPVNGAGEIAGMQLIPGSCRDEHYEDEKYVCGSHQESYSCPETETYRGTCEDSERYACGKTCRSMNNGFANCDTKYCTRTVTRSCNKTRTIPKTCTRTVKEYCTRPINRPKCGYQTQEWRRVNTLVESGQNEQSPRWPEYTAQPLERTRREALYEMTVTYDGDEDAAGVQPESFTKELQESDLKVWTLHRKVKVELSLVGIVTSFQPSDE